MSTFKYTTINDYDVNFTGHFLVREIGDGLYRVDARVERSDENGFDPEWIVASACGTDLVSLMVDVLFDAQPGTPVDVVRDSIMETDSGTDEFGTWTSYAADLIV